MNTTPSYHMNTLFGIKYKFCFAFAKLVMISLSYKNNSNRGVSKFDNYCHILYIHFSRTYGALTISLLCDNDLQKDFEVSRINYTNLFFYYYHFGLFHVYGPKFVPKSKRSSIFFFAFSFGVIDTESSIARMR